MGVNLSNLKPPKGRKRPKKRIGRGESSGWGKTAGRGNKGQRARTGTGKTHSSFEGGQMPLVRRIPKRGFINIFRVPSAEINVETLNRFPAGSEVGLDELKSAGLMKGKTRVKILGKGELKHSLTIKAHAFSESAKSKIEAAGGKAEVL
ncbi:MAG TPA: 50S ribosomal protein L15 [bacterium]|nr:50S ribosomal protein L15 [bacterium]